MRSFAEAEVFIPDGPYKGDRFKCSTQPYAGLWLDAMDSYHFTRFVSTGPTQSGKTLLCSAIPVMYHLFEMKETVIFGLPSMELAADKWAIDLKPAIEASRYKNELPTTGPGSRDGTGNLTSIRFRSGVTLKFMSGGGGDKKRASFTSRVLVITETDGLDVKGKSSVEADKIRQMEARTGAFGSRARIYMECTVTTAKGRTWSEYEEGTQSRIVRPCPHCGHWITPERDHLIGWKDADNVEVARENAQWVCPECKAIINDDERRAMNQRSKLLHKGQEITESGEIVGAMPKTDTLGFRWSLFDNHFKSAADAGAEEWKGLRAEDQDSAERALRQFWWCLPYEPDLEDLSNLDAFSITRKQSGIERYEVPEDAVFVTVGVDLGKYWCYWTAIAWTEDASGFVVDYGRFDVKSNEIGVNDALLSALYEFREEVLLKGWKQGQETKLPDVVLVDSSWSPDPAYKWASDCSRSGFRAWPSKGYGAAQQGLRKTAYSQPKSTGSIVIKIGNNYHFSRLPSGKFLAEVNADYWKSWLHSRWETPQGKNGSLSLFKSSPHEHLTFARHQVAEKKVVEFVAGQGSIERWTQEMKANHWLDATSLACVGGHIAGIRLIGEKPSYVDKSKPIAKPLRMPDGRPFLITER